MSNSFDTRPLIPSQTNNEGDSVSLSISASDSTSGTLKYAAYGLPAGLVINPSTGAVTGTVAAGDAANGPYTVTVGANDSTYNAPTTFTWNVNSPISITPPAGQTDDVGSSVSVTILASDSRSGTTLTYTATGLPPGVYLNPGSGVISGTVGIGGSWQSTITVSDGTYSANVPLNWSVSSPIVITDPGALANSVGDSVSQQITATDTASGTLSYTATGLPPGLSISSSTGLISGTVGSSASTTTPYTPTVTVSDGTHTAIDTFTWSISPAGPIVVTNPGSQTNTAGDQVVLQLQATDTNGQTLLYSATGLPAGLYINPTTGEIFGTVSSSAVSTVTVEAADGSHDATQAFTWTVNAAGHVTMTNPGDQASAEGASVSLSISASDSSGTLRYVAFNLPPGLEISTSTGAISGTVGAGDAANGPYTVTVVAGDGTYWASQTFNWTVNNPVTISAPADQTNNEGDTVSLSISASDSTSGTLSYAALGLPPGLKINASTGAITGTVGVGATAAGPYGVTIVAGDGTYSSTQTFNWTVNSPITITPPATQTNNEGDSVSLSVSASDSRSGTTLTYSALGLPPGLAINASTGAISGTVALGDAAVGSYFPTIIVGDGTYYNSQNVEWDVNSPVSITDPGAEANVVGDVVSLQVTAVDASSGTMTYAATGLPAGLSISTSTGLVSGTISSSATDIGFYATTVTVGDGTYVQTDTFGWAVAAAGTVTMTTPSNQSSTEGNSASLSISASDSGSGTLKYIAESLPGGLKINPSTGAITGTLALADAANGPYTVTVIATDGTNSAQETFTWTVSSPVTISTVSAQTNTEGNTVSLSISASDASSGTLKYSAVGLPAGLAINTGTGAITGTVALGDAANGSYTVTVTAGDGTYSTNLTFTWTVSSPVAVTLPVAQTNTESDTPSLSISASDSSSGTLMYSAVGLPAGLKINTSTGAITGTVALGTAATGQYSVTVTASDGTYTASQTFAWTINSPITITPLADEIFSEGNAVSLQIQASDSSSGTLTYDATGLPSGLSLNATTGVISGTISNSVAAVANILSTFLVSDGTYSTSGTIQWFVMAPGFGMGNAAAFFSPNGPVMAVWADAPLGEQDASAGYVQAIQEVLQPREKELAKIQAQNPKQVQQEAQNIKDALNALQKVLEGFGVKGIDPAALKQLGLGAGATFWAYLTKALATYKQFTSKDPGFLIGVVQEFQRGLQALSVGGGAINVNGAAAQQALASIKYVLLTYISDPASKDFALAYVKELIRNGLRAEEALKTETDPGKREFLQAQIVLGNEFMNYFTKNLGMNGFTRKDLSPLTPDAVTLAQLVRDLDNNDFNVRNAAYDKLLAVINSNNVAKKDLQAILAGILSAGGPLSAELKTRLQNLVNQ